MVPPLCKTPTNKKHKQRNNNLMNENVWKDGRTGRNFLHDPEAPSWIYFEWDCKSTMGDLDDHIPLEIINQPTTTKKTQQSMDGGECVAKWEEGQGLFTRDVSPDYDQFWGRLQICHGELDGPTSLEGTSKTTNTTINWQRKMRGAVWRRTGIVYPRDYIKIK